MVKEFQIGKIAQTNQIVKCGTDPTFFINKYVKIQHPVKGLLSFETYPFQDECINAFKDNRFNIVLKSRQLGLSTITAAYCVWLAIYHKDKEILVIATKLNTAMNFIQKVRIMLDNLPKWIMLTKYEPTKQSISFDNGSKITAVPTSDDAGRSNAISLLVIDEAAWIEKFDDIWTGLYPTLSEGGNAILLSTPNGIGGQYYKLWMEAENKINDFNPIRLPWDVHPFHDEAWFKKETKNLPARKVKQEYLCVEGTTKIITPDGYKIASDIAINDLVLTHKGTFEKILNVHSRVIDDDEKIFSVSSPGNRKNKFLITGNHPMLSYRFWKISSQGPCFDYVINNQLISQWITVEECASKKRSSDNIVNVLIPKLDQSVLTNELKTIDLSMLFHSTKITETTCHYDKQWGYTNRFVDVNFNLGKFIGLYLAEGCSGGKKTDLGFHKNELNSHVKWCVDFLKSLNCLVQIDNGKNLQHNGCRLWTYNKHIRALVRLFVHGDYAYEKILNTDVLFKTNIEFIRGLLYGHYLGDGLHNHDKKFTIASTSSKLIYQLRTFNTMFGLYPRIGYNKVDIVNRHDLWYLEFQAKNASYLDLLENGQQYKSGSRTCLVNEHFVGRHTLVDVTNENKNIIVYDFKVENNSSFVANSATLHNCDFLGSGDTFLSADVIENIRANIKSPIEKIGPRLSIWIWKKPEPGKKYVITSDVARGDAADFSTFSIFDHETCELVAEYMGKIQPDKLADLIDEYGRIYNEALACVEINTFGYFTNIRLKDLKYPHLYYKSATIDPFKYQPTDLNEVPGFTTDSKSRPLMLAKLEEVLRTQTMVTYSQRLYDQLLAFIYIGNKAQASKDSNDDLVISSAIGAWLINKEVKLNVDDVAMTYAILAATSVDRKEQNQLPGEINNAQSLINPALRGVNSKNVYKPIDASQSRYADIADFSWLLK